MDVPSAQFLTGSELLSKAMRDIRKKRGLKTSEIARRMGMPLRSYEHFESGRGRISYERLRAFAEATDSDPYGLLGVILFQSAEFASRVADNKLLQIMMLSLRDLHDELGEDITYLDISILVSAFTKTMKELLELVRKRNTFAEEWLAHRSQPHGGRKPNK